MAAQRPRSSVTPGAAPDDETGRRWGRFDLQRIAMSDSIHQQMAALRYSVGQGVRAIDLRALFVPCALLAIWEGCVRFGYIDPLFLPAPTDIFRALWTSDRPVNYGDNIAASLWRIALAMRPRPRWRFP